MSSEVTGQVIVERSFPTKAAAEEWIAIEIEAIRQRNIRARLTVESDVWEPA